MNIDSSTKSAHMCQLGAKKALLCVLFCALKVSNDHTKPGVILAKWFQNIQAYFVGEPKQMIPKWKANVNKIDELAQC